MPIQHLTGATEPRRPDVCRSCVWWQTQGARSTDKRRWIQGIEDEFGAWGEVYLDGDRHVASLQYGPAPAFPRARTLPAGPASDDAVLVTCAYLSDPSSPWSLQSLFLACIGACHERGVPAIEAFAFVHAAEAEFAERFLYHRTVFPRDFLADYGFRTLRSAGRVELMRLELGGLQPVTDDGFVAQAVRRAAEIITGPPPAPAPAS
jgi:hypothetical protein